MAIYVDMNRDQKKKFPVLGWCFALSITLHLIVGLYRTVSQPSPAVSEQYNEPIEVADYSKIYPKVAEKKSEQKKQDESPPIAETEDANNRDLDPNAKFLGEHNQVAKEEMKAKRVDDFRQKQGSGAKSQEKSLEAGATPDGQSTKGTQEAEIAEDGLGGAETPKEAKRYGVKRNWKSLSLKDLGVGGDGGAEAATDDILKGVREGEGTVLSTREFRFYSYYHRLKELLRQYWKPNVERQITRIWNKGKTINSDEMVTRLLVLLDENGKIQKISKVAGSGYMELDEAAVQAFERAGPFPNPPKGMIDADGFVRIRWDFILQTDSGPAIQWRSQGGVPN